MQTQESDPALEALDDRELRVRLARGDWQHDPMFVPDEQVFRLFCRARAVENALRVGLLSEALSRRLLERARKFALKARIFPGLIDDLKRAAHELASCMWDHLLSSKGDAAHAEKAFGQLFERRAIDFQRKLLAQQRKHQQVNLDALDDDLDDESRVAATEDINSLQERDTPEFLAVRQQEFQDVNGRLLKILTENEYTTYVLLNVGDWQVQEIAKALDVTVKSVNNYKNRALDKIRKEFEQ